MKDLFTIAIVGRPNVGKSALFNRVVRRRKAIIEDIEGVTRDRIYEEVEIFGKEVRFIDTGGIDSSDTVMFSKEIRKQTLLAVEEADAIIFVVDGTSSVTMQDEEVAKLLMKTKKDVVLAVNKVDNDERELEMNEYYSLGLTDIYPVSAIHGSGIADLLERVIRQAPLLDEEESFTDEIEEEVDPAPSRRLFPKVAIVGRPNVGKSTLINQLFGEERCLVSDIAGTTRDAIDVMVNDILFIDTAGLRKKKAECESVDKFATIRSEKAIERCDICILVLDSNQGLTTYEKSILQMIEEKGKACILFLNKWDTIRDLRMEHAILALKEMDPFIAHMPIIVGSAKTGRNVGDLFDSIANVWEGLNLRISTGELNTFLEKAIQKNHPPMIQGKRLRIYYLTQVGTFPPSFVLFVNEPKLLIDSYKKYLINQLRDTYAFTGCPIRFKLHRRKDRHA